MARYEMCGVVAVKAIARFVTVAWAGPRRYNPVDPCLRESLGSGLSCCVRRSARVGLGGGIDPGGVSRLRNVGRRPRRLVPEASWRGGAGVTNMLGGTVNLAGKLSGFQEYWSPKIVGELNEQYVKLAKLKGEFVWHRHDTEDELFLVLRGRLLIKQRDRDVVVNEGEFYIVPRGVEHKPVADDEVHVLLFEPQSTLNTGNVRNERTVENLETI